MSIFTKSSPKYQLPAKQERHAYIARNFNEIAHKYDLFNDLITFGFHRLWKQKVIRYCNLQKKQPANVLDLCCGSGDISIYLTQQQHPKLSIQSLDFSSEMLAILQKRLSELQNRDRARHPVQIIQGDASDLSQFADGSQDAVTIGFGLRNVQKRAQCLSEARRVLKDDGRLVILDVGQVRPAFFAYFHAIFFEKIVPIIGYLVHGKRHEMYAYLPASAREYPNQEKLKKELLEAGFLNVSYENLFWGSAVIHVASNTQ